MRGTGGPAEGLEARSRRLSYDADDAGCLAATQSHARRRARHILDESDQRFERAPLRGLHREPAERPPPPSAIYYSSLART